MSFEFFMGSASSTVQKVRALKSGGTNGTFYSNEWLALRHDHPPRRACVASVAGMNQGGGGVEGRGSLINLETVLSHSTSTRLDQLTTE